MKRRLIILAILPTLFFLASSYMKQDPKSLKIGKTAPMKEEKLKNIDGNELSLAELKKENGLIVIFSCNTCPFVVGNDHFAGWEVQYDAIRKDAESKNIGIVLINSNEAKRLNEDSFEAMVKHAQEQSYNMPYLVDVNSKLADAFGAKTTPHVFLFDKEFKLAYSGCIDNTWDTKRTEDIAYLTTALKALSTNEKIKENATTPRGCSIKRNNN
jgi:thioredoxin-related protein